MEVQRIKENRDRFRIEGRSGGVGPGVSVTMFTFTTRSTASTASNSRAITHWSRRVRQSHTSEFGLSRTNSSHRLPIRRHTSHLHHDGWWVTPDLYTPSHSRHRSHYPDQPPTVTPTAPAFRSPGLAICCLDRLTRQSVFGQWIRSPTWWCIVRTIRPFGTCAFVLKATTSYLRALIEQHGCGAHPRLLLYGFSWVTIPM